MAWNRKFVKELVHNQDISMVGIDILQTVSRVGRGAHERRDGADGGFP